MLTVGVRESHYRVLDEYVRACQGPMGLDHWEITISRESVDDDNTLAEVEWDQHKPKATIKFHDMIEVATPSEVREVIGHELTHLKHSPLDDLVGDLGSTFRGQFGAFFTALYKRETERFVEAMEPVVAKLLPEFGGWDE